MNETIQRAILSTFLWSNDLHYDTKEAFLINPNLFTGDRKLIAAKINEVTNTDDRFYGLLNLELEQTFTTEWMELAIQNTLSFKFALRYYNELKKTRGIEI